jgi:SNF2 family DNA or RNA helicase
MVLMTSLLLHQISAVEKLRNLKVGALYMEMGTGKTRVALELIAQRLDAGKVDHVLWLCPCSVKENLRRDILKHADSLQNITICGIETLSSSIRENVRLLKLVQSQRVFLVVDESNLVKNHKALRTKNIVRISEHCKYKLILNGTPISKCEKDLYAQWYILDWRILGYRSFWSFAANHLEYDDRIKGRIVNTLNVDYLVRKIAPYTYQVKKSECLDLPSKTYNTEYYYLSQDQRDHYCSIADELLFQVDEMEPNTIYRLFSGLQNITSGFKVILNGKHMQRELFFKKSMDNPRMQLLFDLLDKTDEKVIVFCKYTQEIHDIISIANERYGAGSAVAFYGELNQRNRQESIKAFENNSRIFVANKTCAGYGLNLQFCSYVIYYNNDWDYATRSQSEDRVHRIGQDHNVHIIDICAAHTLDERILDCLQRKESLVDNFKAEIEKQKDKESFVQLFIYRKDRKGRLKVRDTHTERTDALKELKEHA